MLPDARQPRTFLTLAWVLLGGLAVLILLLPTGTTGAALGLRRFMTPAIDSDVRIAQRFRMKARNLTALDVRFAAAGPSGGVYRLTIRDRDEPGEVRTADVSAATLTRQDSYTFSFAPFPDSTFHEFELSIEPAPHDPGYGVAAWATRGAPAEEHVLLFNDTPRWGTLAFRARTSALPYWQALASPAGEGRPAPWWGLVGLAGMWLSAGYVMLAFIPRMAGGRGGAMADLASDGARGHRDAAQLDERRHR